MVEETGRSESEEQRHDREANEYWARLSARGDHGSDSSEQNYQPLLKQTTRAENIQPSFFATSTTSLTSPSSIVSDETDPLVLIIEALRKNTDATQAALAEVRATRQEIIATAAQTTQQLEILKNYIFSNTRAVETFTYGEEVLADAKAARLRWGIGGFIMGAIILEAGLFLWFHFLG